MDLGATAQIETLDKIAEENGISVPRLRGYRLMIDGEPYTEEETKEEIASIKSSYRRLHEPLSTLYWVSASVKEQHGMWNKYVGRNDVLYIHSRCGYPPEEVLKAPWFLDWVSDAFDPTYCTIYAKIKPIL